ncbi:hypothetical protein BGX31_001188 [Mortierella sp. GBA43]|nr:hypothetical protein BGX31_001188 [Mortierella sp. GBA43]
MPAFSYSSIAASNVRSQNGTPGPSSFDVSATDPASANPNSTPGFSTDSLNPFKYSKELMLSLYRPSGLPIEFERHEYMTSEESLQPMSSLPFSEQELKVEQREREREREREPEDDGLWNSPVGAVGSFDANGVFRLIGGGADDLQPLEALEEPTSKRAMDESKGAGPASGVKSSAIVIDTIAAGDQASKADHPSPDQQHLKSQEKPSDGYLFSGGLLSGKGLGSASVREDAEFTTLTNTSSSGSNAPLNPEPPFDSQPLELSKWLYRDPSGSIQGPFSSEEMHEWFKGGFFTADLLIKREHDSSFEPLGAMIRRIGSDDKPFLLAGVLRQEQPAPPIRPSLAPGRQALSQMNLSSSWVGMSAPSTPSTPSFGVDRMLLQQQHQQHQHASGDLFSSTNTLGQQRSGFGSSQDPTVLPGLESRWGSGFFGGRGQSMDTTSSGGGWGGGDAFPRSHGPLGGPQFIEQQQRLHNQELERQQYMQMLQRQSQMQAILHQQQFMQAQQQYGSDPHTLQALLAQQQAQQRQLQLRYQQLQFAGLHAQAPSTPTGTGVPWGGMSMGQPSSPSPWATTIIPQTSENYFDAISKGDISHTPHGIQHQQPQPTSPQHPQFPPFPHEQSQSPSQPSQPQEELPAVEDQFAPQDPLPELHDKAATDALADRLENLEVHADSEKEQYDVERAVEEEKLIDIDPAVEQTLAEESVEEEDHVIEAAHDTHVDAVQESTTAWETDYVKKPEPEQPEEDHEQESVEENVSETASSTAAESTQRPIRAIPAPWAKPAVSDEDSSEKKGPTLREIQEMEAKKAEEARAERQAQMAAAVAAAGSNMLDFTKGMPGAPAWSSGPAAAPKKKTLKEIQQEEEAAMKRARASQQTHATAAPSGGQSTGLTSVVASGTGSIGRRYADTIGPKPVAVSPVTGAWGSASTAGSRPSLATRNSAVFSSNPSLNSPTHSGSKGSDNNNGNNNSWIEVGSKRDTHAPSAVSSPAVSRGSTTTPSGPSSATAPGSGKGSSNSNEPRPASEDFLRWCRTALKDLQGVVLEDFIQMLLTFPLNPDPMTVEIISESIYANSRSLNGRQFADEFTKRRKADAYPNGAPVSSSAAGTGNVASSIAGASGADSTFRVVSKKGKKKAT